MRRPCSRGTRRVCRSFQSRVRTALPLLLIELKWNKILLVGITYDAKSKKHTCRIEECRK